MAKDPAVLWYYQDYLSGTEHMSFAEQGAYARLLNKQADIGHFSLQFAKNILKKDFSKIWPSIKGKFIEDTDGLLFNERMDAEIIKRRKHSEKQKENILKRWNKSGKHGGIYDGITNSIPLENENENTSGNSGDSLKGDPYIPYSNGNGLLPEMLKVYKKHFPCYPHDEEQDYPALLQIARKLGKYFGFEESKILSEHAAVIGLRWGELMAFAKNDEWHADKPISVVNKTFQSLLTKFLKTQPAGNESSSSAPRETVRERKDRIDLESIHGKGSTISS